MSRLNPLKNLMELLASLPFDSPAHDLYRLHRIAELSMPSLVVLCSEGDIDANTMTVCEFIDRYRRPEVAIAYRPAADNFIRTSSAFRAYFEDAEMMDDPLVRAVLAEFDYDARLIKRVLSFMSPS